MRCEFLNIARELLSDPTIDCRPTKKGSQTPCDKPPRVCPIANLIPKSNTGMLPLHEFDPSQADKLPHTGLVDPVIDVVYIKNQTDA